MAELTAPTTGSTIAFETTITRDGDTWDLTDADVTLYLVKPSGAVLTKSATILDETAGTVRYTCTTSDLDEVGEWGYRWRVEQTGVDVVQELQKIWVAEGL